MFEEKTINMGSFGGSHFSGLDIFKIFSWYEWLIIFIIGFLVFKYFEKYFILEDSDKKNE